MEILLAICLITSVTSMFWCWRAVRKLSNITEDMKYYRWFIHCLTLLVQNRPLNSDMQRAVEAETKIARKIVGE